MSPQSSLYDFEDSGLRDLSELTKAEREVYISVEREGPQSAKLLVRQIAAPERSATFSNVHVFDSTTATRRCQKHGDRPC